MSDDLWKGLSDPVFIEVVLGSLQVGLWVEIDEVVGDPTSACDRGY